MISNKIDDKSLKLGLKTSNCPCLQALIFYPLFRKAADRITSFYSDLMGAECKPLTMGGDHFVTYPILRAIAEKHGPVGRDNNGTSSISFTIRKESIFQCTLGQNGTQNA